MSAFDSNPGSLDQSRTGSREQSPGFSCSDFTPRSADVPVPYWPVDEPIPYRLTETAPHFEDMGQRAREAGL